MHIMQIVLNLYNIHLTTGIPESSITFPQLIRRITSKESYQMLDELRGFRRYSDIRIPTAYLQKS
jgi:hypothetical protein